MFSIEILDEAEYHSTMAKLAVTLADLLAIADHIGLPQPRYATVSASGHGYISLQFPPAMSSVDAILLWASTYCAPMRSETHEGKTGPEMWPGTQFDLDGVTVDLYACIPVPEAEPITSTEQTATPF